MVFFGVKVFAVGVPVVFEHAVFALDGALGGSFVTHAEIVLFDLVGVPGEEGAAFLKGVEEIVFAFGAQAFPFSGGGFVDEGVEDGGFGGAGVLGAPGGEEFEPIGFILIGEDERVGAEAVTSGVAGGDGLADGRGGSGAAAVAFFEELFGGAEVFGVGGHVGLGGLVCWGRWFLRRRRRGGCDFFVVAGGVDGFC